MELHYLDFETSDEADGRMSFDAMATVLPGRVDAVLEEVSAVLAHAHARYGEPGLMGDDGEWDYELQAWADPGGEPLPLQGSPADGWRIACGVSSTGRVTITLTLGGSAGFGEDFMDAFKPGA